jgi:hypothetical protein
MHSALGRSSARLIIVLPHAAGFALSVLVFYPGVMNYDARYIYADIAKGRFGDWQSPVMGWLWSVVDPIAPGPASFFLVTAASYWLGFALLSLALASRSSRLAFAVPLLALMPPAFAFVGMIWRDVLFACAWLVAVTLVFATAESRRPVRLPAQAVALALVAFGVLLRPNAILAAPILAAYAIWPQCLALHRAAVLYLPAIAVFLVLIQVVYYGIFDAMRQKPWHSIIVFDLGGISHFTKQNQFPVSWNAQEIALLTQSCYRPAPWNVYWNAEPCHFVMDRLEREKLFGSPVLVDAWMRAIVAHPLAYLRHRAGFMTTFLAQSNLTIWIEDISDPPNPVLSDNRAFAVLRHVHDALHPTPLFWPGTWLILNAGLCLWAWRKRHLPAGAFVVAGCGSAVAYVLTFFAVGVAAEFRYALWAVFAGLAGLVAAGAIAAAITADVEAELAVRPKSLN